MTVLERHPFVVVLDGAPYRRCSNYKLAVMTADEIAKLGNAEVVFGNQRIYPIDEPLDHPAVLRSR